MKVGLYFGSFNPIHIGHLALANYIVEYGNIDQLWFVVSPHNPLKKKHTLLADYHRLEMVEKAIEGYDKFRASNIEFSLPKPSYTIHTLTYLKEKYPNYEFSLIMGSDGLQTFTKWRNYEQILENYALTVYPRPGSSEHELFDLTNVNKVDAPVMEISSSFIRKAISEGKNVSCFMPQPVAKYVDEMHFYE